MLPTVQLTFWYVYEVEDWNNVCFLPFIAVIITVSISATMLEANEAVMMNLRRRKKQKNKQALINQQKLNPNTNTESMRTSLPTSRCLWLTIDGFYPCNGIIISIFHKRCLICVALQVWGVLVSLANIYLLISFILCIRLFLELWKSIFISFSFKLYTL